MPTILDQIVTAKRREIAAAKERLPETELERQLAGTPLSPPRGFRAALEATPLVRVIAEVKRQSPSAGAIQAAADATAVAKSYAAGGAACVSVLTDGPYFGGSLEDLRAVREAVQIPLLRKDFILDRYQVLEARLAGADAVLLIAEILDDATLISLLREIAALGMDALAECYDQSNLHRLVDSGANLIGINNRDLRSFEVRLEHTLDLAQHVPPDRTLVSESGIRTRADVQLLAAGDVKAILVGETLMRSGDVAVTLEGLGTVACRSR
jgi:indole-3-glycerol phosphate synthase